MSETSQPTSSTAAFSPCKIQKKEAVDTKPHIKVSRARAEGNSITIHGYSEVFAVSPAVKVYKDGCFCGQVARCGNLKVALDKDCILKFKCNLRSAEVSVKKGEDKHVYLFFNRFTGSLNAQKARDDNREEVQRRKDKSARGATLLSFFLILGLVGTLLFLFVFKNLLLLFL